MTGPRKGTDTHSGIRTVWYWRRIGLVVLATCVVGSGVYVLGLGPEVGLLIGLVMGGLASPFLYDFDETSS